jgi:hypothetical protein
MFGMHCCFIRFFITSFTCSKVKVYSIPNRAYDEGIPDGKLTIKANRKGIFDHLWSENCEKLKRDREREYDSMALCKQRKSKTKICKHFWRYLWTASNNIQKILTYRGRDVQKCPRPFRDLPNHKIIYINRHQRACLPHISKSWVNNLGVEKIRQSESYHWSRSVSCWSVIPCKEDVDPWPSAGTSRFFIFLYLSERFCLTDHIHCI